MNEAKATPELVQRRIDAMIKLKDASEEFSKAWSGSVEAYLELSTFSLLAETALPAMLMDCRKLTGSPVAALFAFCTVLDIDLEVSINQLLKTRKL